jgi:hypothetical protein
MLNSLNLPTMTLFVVLLSMVQCGVWKYAVAIGLP